VEDGMFREVMKRRSLPSGKGEGGLGWLHKEIKVQVSDTTMMSKIVVAGSIKILNIK
jgi:hypothetical protein